MHRREPSSWNTRLSVLLPVVALLGMLAWVTLRHQQSQEIGSALARGEAPPVPSMSLPTLDGRRLSLSQFRGHPMVVNFWASWCVPCAEEAPILEAVWQEFRTKGLVVLGVDTQDLEPPARAFLLRHTVTYPNVRDPDGSLARTFGTTGVPETFFVGSDGRIRGKFPGEQINRGVWRVAVMSLLAGSARVP